MQTLLIDGSQGEGGGQMLRTSLALSLALGRPIQLTNIRSGRGKPGLLRQHLTCVRAACAITDQPCHAQLADTELVFEPRPVRAGSYRFDVGSAGSTALILQTVLMPLLMAEGSSEVMLTGGTHAQGAPPIEALSHSFLPLLRTLGARAELSLESAGFFPAGGGVVRLGLSGLGGRRLQPLELVERGALGAATVRLHAAQLPDSVPLRQGHVLERRLTKPNLEVHLHPASPGPGNAIVVMAPFDALTEVFASFGGRGIRAERVAEAVCKQFRKHLASGAPVGVHLADQLLVPLCLGSGGVFRCASFSSHLHTNADVVQAFLPGAVRLQANGMVHVQGLIPEA